MQIRSPSGSNGLYILKINPDIKKQPVSTSCSFYLVFSNLIRDVKENIHENDISIALHNKIRIFQIEKQWVVGYTNIVSIYVTYFSFFACLFEALSYFF